jgi:hypothetical protein
MAFWNPESTVSLYRVPWDSSYDNVIDWKVQDRDAYFDSIPSKDVVTKSDSAYMPLGMQICVDVPYEQARKFNYVVVSNPGQPVEGDEPYKLYYFIVGTGYPNPSSTVLTCSLDVWTTRFGDVSFDVGYVERGHIALANAGLVDAPAGGYTKALNLYCTQSDGVATGDQYITYDVDTFQISDPTKPTYVAVVSTAVLYSSEGKSDWGTVDNPNLRSATGTYVDGVFSGCDVTILSTRDLSFMLGALSTAPWVAQCIISIGTVPNKLLNFDYLKEVTVYFGEVPFKIFKPNTKFKKSMNWNFGDVPQLSDDSVIDVGRLKSDKRWLKTEDDPVRFYRDLDKLNAFPYSVIELASSCSGQSVFLKPELLGGDVTPLVFIACAVQPFASCAVAPKFYGHFQGNQFSVAVNDNGTVDVRDIPYGEFLNCAIWFDDFPQWSIVNNAYIAFMASTAHTRAYQYDNANWSLNRSNLAAKNSYTNSQIDYNTAYGNAVREINRSQDVYAAQYAQREREVSAGNLSTAVSTVASLPDALKSGTKLGGGLGAVGMAAAAVTPAIASMYTNATSLDTMQAVNAANYKWSFQNARASRDASKQMAENNLATATTVNRGDYDMEVQGLDAAYADARLTQPSQSGNSGGNGLRYANGVEWLVEVRYKTLSDDAIIRNGDFFKRFGYSVNRYVNMPASLSLCNHYTYWKVQQLETSSALMNEDEKDVMKGIFSKGVTVWRDPADVGHVSPKANSVEPSSINHYY